MCHRLKKQPGLRIGPKKTLAIIDSLKEKYVEIIKGKERLTILAALDTVKTRLSPC